MTIAEGVQGVIAYKAYASGAITANTLDATPPTTGAQYLRRVSSSLNLRKNTYQSAEVRSDRQIIDFRHGQGRVDGDIAGELSPATWFDLIVATHRDTKVSAIALSESDLTSVTASNSGSTFTFGGGDPVGDGLGVGDVIRFTNMSVSANNSTNFTITGFSGTSNRTMSVTPAPTDQSSDTAFNLARPGCTTIVPASSFVSRKYGIEAYQSDLDQSRLFAECRATRYQASMPASGMVGFTQSFLGRSMSVLSGGSAPYFPSPTAETTTGVTAAVNGLALLDGTAIGVLTGINFQLDTSASVAEVVGQNFPAEIFLGRANVTGSLTAFLSDSTFLDAFADETEIALLAQVTTTSAAASPAITVYLPRVKLGSADVAMQGEAGQLVTSSFQALRYNGSAAGVDTTTIRWHDTEAS